MMPRKYLIAVIVLMVIPLIVGLALLPSMPAVVPTHFDINGNADGYGSPLGLVLGLGVVPLVLGALMVGIPFLGPLRENFKRFGVAYGQISAMLMLGLGEVMVLMLLKSAGRNVPVVPGIMVVLGLMLAVVGNLLGKVRRNFWMGIRTPWTLANEQVWERTHRLGGRIMVLYGLAVAIAALIPPPWIGFVVMIVGAVALTIWCLVYSYAIYRKLGQVDDMHRGDGGENTVASG